MVARLTLTIHLLLRARLSHSGGRRTLVQKEFNSTAGAGALLSVFFS
jgi:hypothetical protein